MGFEPTTLRDLVECYNHWSWICIFILRNKDDGDHYYCTVLLLLWCVPLQFFFWYLSHVSATIPQLRDTFHKIWAVPRMADNYIIIINYYFYCFNLFNLLLFLTCFLLKYQRRIILFGNDLI